MTALLRALRQSRRPKVLVRQKLIIGNCRSPQQTDPSALHFSRKTASTARGLLSPSIEEVNGDRSFWKQTQGYLFNVVPLATPEGREPQPLGSEGQFLSTRLTNPDNNSQKTWSFRTRCFACSFKTCAVCALLPTQL